MARTNKQEMIDGIKVMLARTDITDAHRVKLLQMLAKHLPVVPNKRSKKKSAASDAAPTRPRWLEQ